MRKNTRFASFATIVISVMAALMIQIDSIEAQRLPQDSDPFPQWAYWNPVDDTILVSNGKTMQLYTSQFYLLRDVRLLPEDIDADPEAMISISFYATWHPTGRWVYVRHMTGPEIWDASLTHRILSLYDKNLYQDDPSYSPTVAWHSRKPWLAFITGQSTIIAYDVIAETHINEYKGISISGIAWMPETDSVAFTDYSEGFTIWDVIQDPIIHPIQRKNTGSFTFNHSGSLLADILQGELIVWSTDIWKEVFHLEPQAYFNHLAWIDDHRIGVLDNKEQLSIVDINTGQTIFLDTLPEGNFGMSWNAAGSQFLVINKEDITVRNTETGEVVASLKAVLDGSVIVPVPTTIP